MTRPILLILFGLSLTNSIAQTDSLARIDYDGFEKLAAEVEPYRAKRLIKIDTFNAYSRDPTTIILDTRSKAAYDEIHILGAVHLNFSDFTAAKLAAVIPSLNTRILIYCNNNIESELNAMRNKEIRLALNIPTFINLYGYGYKNIYELQDYLLESDPRLTFVRGKA